MEQDKPEEKPTDLVPWDGSLVIDPAMVSSILESWEIFEDLDNELHKTTNS